MGPFRVDGLDIPQFEEIVNGLYIFCRLLMGFTGFSIGFYWVLLSFSWFYWVLLGFTGLYWFLLGFH